MSKKRILRADDKRRNYHKVGVEAGSGNGAAKRASAVFHDRRHGSNGAGKRAS